MSTRFEHWVYTVPLRLRSLFRRRAVDRELDEEVSFHLESRIAEGIARGLSEQSARWAAMRAFDGLEQRKEEMRDVRHIHWFTDFVQDAHYAFRSLRRTPAFTAFIVITLALGIGVTSSVFSLADALLLRPIPVPQPSRVLNLVSTTPDHARDDFSYPEYLDIGKNVKSYAGVVAYTDMSAIAFSSDPKALPRVKGGVMVSGNFFRVLGVQPQIGRSFRPDEDQASGHDPAVVLGDEFWRREFAGNPGVIGRQVRLNGIDFTVIGVAARGFSGTDVFEHPDLYVPLAVAPRLSSDITRKILTDRSDRELNVKGRLKAGATVAQAQAEIAVIARNFARSYPALNANRGAAVRTGFEMRKLADSGDFQLLTMLGVLALAVLLVACANAASLLLSRARTRVREVAVRLAIGAGRFRLVRFLMTESLMIALAGGCLGVLLGYGGVKFIGTYKIPTELPVVFTVRMDARVLLVSFVLTILCAVTAGLAPALQSARTDLVGGLKSANAEMPGRNRFWGRNILVVVQVAASFMLLTVALMLIHGFAQKWEAGGGFPMDHLLLASFDPRLTRHNAMRTRAFFDHLLLRTRSSPGVRSASLTQGVPMGPTGFDAVNIVPDGYTMPRDHENLSVMLDAVSPEFFATVRIPLLNGRDFRDTDTARKPRVAVVNEQFAKHYWPHNSAVGKHFRLDSRSGDPVEIVGVAKTTKYNWIGEAPTDFIYMPIAQHPSPTMTLVTRTAGPPEDFAPSARAIVKAVDPNQPMFDVQTMESFYHNRSVAAPLMIVQLVSTMGLVGLALSVAGLYALITYNVNRKTREIGVRMAIGASSANVLGLVMRQGLILVLTGAVFGLGLGAAAGGLVNSLFATTRFDLGAYAVVLPCVLTVTMLASYIPARRASRIAPMRALRYE